MEPFPCHHLKPLEAQFLWRLAEENFAENRAKRNEPVTLEQTPARKRLAKALESLDEGALQDTVALMWLGRADDDTPYPQLRARASTLHVPDYIAEKGLALHHYFRRALESFGLGPLHELDESLYRSPLEVEEDEANP